MPLDKMGEFIHPLRVRLTSKTLACAVLDMSVEANNEMKSSGSSAFMRMNG
jgi:hypothetical protein